jgi:hypothetical protein
VNRTVSVFEGTGRKNKHYKYLYCDFSASPSVHEFHNVDDMFGILCCVSCCLFNLITLHIPSCLKLHSRRVLHSTGPLTICNKSNSYAKLRRHTTRNKR